MARTLDELARLVDGTVVGDPQLVVTGASPLATVEAGEITLIDSVDRVKKLTGSPAAAVVVPVGAVCSLPSVVVADVHGAFAKIVAAFRPRRTVSRIGVSPRAQIGANVRLGSNVDVHPGAVLGDDVEIGADSTIHSGVHIMAGSKIGRGVTIFPNAVLYEDTHVGDRSIIHASAVLGAYGFGYKFIDGRHQLAAQLGNVELGADVEIGAGTTIDRGAYGPTRIGEGTKIDDQVMIGHNCILGKHNLICSQVGIAGSTTTGDYVVMAGQVGIKDHVHIGSRSVLGAKAGIIGDVEEGLTMFGSPATPDREQLQKQIAWSKLPEMRQQMKALQKTVAELQQRLAGNATEAA